MKAAGILVVAGAVITVIAVFLPWVSGGGESINGMDILTDGEGELYDGPGQINLVLGLILAGLGIPLIIAGRVLAVAIIAIVVAALTALMGLGLAGFASATADLSSDASVAIGAFLQPIAPLISLGGAIWATAKRRKPAPAPGYGY